MREQSRGAALLDLVSTVLMGAASLAMLYLLWGARAAGDAGPGRDSARAAAKSPIVATTTIDWTRHNYMGSRRAGVALIEYSDLECPFCMRHARETFPGIKAQFVDSNRLVYVFRHFPIDSIHPAAGREADLVECAGQQDRFWDARTLSYDSSSLQLDTLLAAPWASGLDTRKLSQCMETRHPAVLADADAARKMGVDSTPTFLLASRSGPDDAWEVKTTIRGAQQLDVFARAIQALTSEQHLAGPQ